MLHERIIVNDELGRMWKEGVMSSLKVLTQYLPGRTEEKHKRNLSE
jgi:hypothetical protein